MDPSQPLLAKGARRAPHSVPNSSFGTSSEIFLQHRTPPPPGTSSDHSSPSLTKTPTTIVRPKDPQTECGELYGPLQWEKLWLPIRLFVGLLLLPLMGGFWMHFSVKESVVGRNPQDNKVVGFCGLMMFLSTICFTANFTSAAGGTDLRGALIFYPVAVMFFLCTSVLFQRNKAVVVKRRAEKIQMEQREFEKATEYLKAFKEDTILPSAKYVIPSATLLGTVLMLLIRTCFPGRASCSGRDVWNLLFDPDLYRDWYFIVMTVFWWVLSIAVLTVSIFGLMLYYQGKRQIEQFTYIQKYSEGQPLLQDLSTDFSKDMAVWTMLWQEMLEGISGSPFERAFVASNALFSTLVLGVALFYVVVQNVGLLSADEEGGENHIAEGTNASVCMAVYGGVVMGVIVAITVKLQRIVEYQVKAISSAQNSLQKELEDNRSEMDSARVAQITSSAQVLSDLDTFLQQSNSATPRIIEAISLDSIRWIAIIGGLLSFNIFFGALYINTCYRAET